MSAARKSIDPRKQPVQKRGQEKVQKIIKATLQLLRRNHPNSITASLIAAKAGINIASLYQFFPNKEAIFNTLFQSWLESIQAGYDRVEEEYLLKTDWRDFFTRIHEQARETAYEPEVATALDYVMAGNPELTEIDEELADKLTQRMAGYLKAYGSTWSEEELIRLSTLLYEFGWTALYHTAGQSSEAAAQTHEWTLQAVLGLIETCLHDATES